MTIPGWVEVEFPVGSGDFYQIRKGNKIKRREDGMVIQYNDNPNGIRRFFEDEKVYPVVRSPLDPRSRIGETDQEKKERDGAMEFLENAFS